MLAPKCCALVIAPARKDRVDNGLERPGSRGDCILHSWCFIKDITEKGGSCPIVRTAINIAVARDMTTAAEGVEKQEQREILRDLGCTQMQGYVSSPPVPPKQLNELLFGQGAATATTAA
jgi:predicted signal transduction protein with EAL and GGDEF domain